MVKLRRATLLRRATACALAVYWMALFVGTHVPLPRSLGVENKDKSLHFLAYAGLAALATLATGSRVQRGLRARHVVLIALAFMAFGAFDELTQPLVNREADWFDWFSDVGGVILGTASGLGVLELLRRTGIVGEQDGQSAEREVRSVE